MHAAPKQPSTFIHIRVQALLNHFKHTTEAEIYHILQNTKKKDLASLTFLDARKLNKFATKEHHSFKN